MGKYYRCEDPSELCPLSRSQEFIPSKDWICPIDCETCDLSRREVSFFRVYRKRLLLWGLIVGALLVLAIVAKSMIPDPLKQELSFLKEESVRLENRYSDLEKRPRTMRTASESLSVIRGMEARSEELRNKIIKEVESGHLDSARAELKTLQLLPEQATQALETARNPQRVSGPAMAEAQNLIRSLQETETLAENFLSKVRKDRRVEFVEPATEVQDSLKSMLARSRIFLKPTPSGSELDETALGKLVESIGENANAATRVVDEFVPPPEIPFAENDATLVVCCTSDLAETLVVPLLEASCSGETINPVSGSWYFTSREPGSVEQKVLVKEVENGEFDTLINGNADLVVTSRPPSQRDSRAFSSAFPNQVITSRSHSEVIALDALTFLAHPDYPKSEVGPDELSSLNWICGPRGGPEQYLATLFDFKRLQSIETRSADAVLRSGSAVAFSAYHTEGPGLRAKRLSFKASRDARVLTPSPFSIGTEDYKFSVRIFAVHSPGSRSTAMKLVKFATSDKGQKVVSSRGYVDPRLRPIGGDASPEILAVLARALGVDKIRGATRISTNFRFAPNESALDIKAVADLERLPRYIAANYPDEKVVILGFTDNTGGPEVNTPLSKARAKFIADKLIQANMTAIPAGLGEQLPVDSNETDEGKARNRRAEVWVAHL